LKVRNDSKVVAECSFDRCVIRRVARASSRPDRAGPDGKPLIRLAVDPKADFDL